jgi:hypothetical protein
VQQHVGVNDASSYRLGQAAARSGCCGPCNSYHTICYHCLQKEKSEGRRRDLQAQLTRMEQQLRQESVRRKKTEVEAGWKVGGGGRQAAIQLHLHQTCLVLSTCTTSCTHT